MFTFLSLSLSDPLEWFQCSHLSSDPRLGPLEDKETVMERWCRQLGTVFFFFSFGNFTCFSITIKSPFLSYTYNCSTNRRRNYLIICSNYNDTIPLLSQVVLRRSPVHICYGFVVPPFSLTMNRRWTKRIDYGLYTYLPPPGRVVPPTHHTRLTVEQSLQFICPQKRSYYTVVTW